MNQVSSRFSEALNGLPSINLKLFLGLSRTPHGLLDVCTPAMAALLCLGSFPPASVILVGLMTAFAGYTAVYALNDLIDFRIDKERLTVTKDPLEVLRVDEVLMRHPVARGALSFRSGIIWFAAWSLIALVGAYWLNPFCALLFLISSSMESLYCKLLRVSHLKIIPSAIVKATGGLAGVYAVAPNPSTGFLAVLFLWLAAWEVGGQNIANDIVDMEEDAKVSALTTLTVLGLPESVFMLLAGVSMAALAGIAIYWVAGNGIGPFYLIGAAVLSWKLLLEPARGVYYDPTPVTAAALFNKASYMPAGFLAVVVVSIILHLN
ncbi:MAG: UbiA family prenyltransferase [Desulfomonile tiedjei]|uniref:UbiA family prenyltransferase n=1 Tax=Desulfomonile tiedjei TaxID=2358 RepID=A0A9D6V2V5_9BACT|nr:UbiA family prenyltransferase [Desulfomonile tiedjei]